MNYRLYRILLLCSFIAALGGILTLLPWSGASYPNLLGYRSLCTFAPAGSLYCFFIAGLICTIRASFIKRKGRENGKRLRPLPVIILVLVLGLAAASTFWFVSVKSRYADSKTGATDTATQATDSATWATENQE